jgi:hypothetical protein
VLPSQDGQFYYVALDKKGEPLDTGETFTRRSSALNAARREHEGRNEKFDSILEYESAKGYLVRETLRAMRHSRSACPACKSRVFMLVEDNAIWCPRKRCGYRGDKAQFYKLKLVRPML